VTKKRLGLSHREIFGLVVDSRQIRQIVYGFLLQSLDN